MGYAIIEALDNDQKKETVKRKNDLATIYELLRTELQSRDLNDVPTDKLIQLIVLLNKQMDDQNIKINSVTYKTGL